MLVIRRRPGESIVIGDGIEVQVTEISATRVKLCITAPREVAVIRKEVFLIREANLAAAAGPEEIAELADRFRNKLLKVPGKRTDMTVGR